MNCPRCGGIGQIMSWQSGSWHVCNFCKGKGHFGKDDRYASEDADREMLGDDADYLEDVGDK